MVVFVLGHLFIMHYQHVPASTGAAFVGRRWAGAAWRAFDWVLLALALSHGVAGAHAVLRERVRGPRARTVLDGAAVAGATIFAALGTLAVAAGSRAAGGSPGPLSVHAWIPAALLGGLLALATLTYLALLGVAAAAAAYVLRRFPAGRWSYPGQWAFALNRIAGLGVLGFLLLHVADVAMVPFAPDLYDRTVAGYALPYLAPMEILLVTAVVYHALNGLRLMALEALDRRAARAHVLSFAVVVVVTALLVIPSVVVLLQGRP